MYRFALAIVAVLFLAGCASVNPYQVAEGQGAFLKNRSEYKGPSYFLYKFINAASSAGRKSFEPDATTALDDAVYTIPAEELTLGLIVYYYPDQGPVTSVGEALGTSFKFLFSASARDRLDAATTKYEIWALNPKWEDAGLQRLRLQAVKGQTYQANCQIEGGKAFLWLEDDSGRRVSDKVPGYGITKHNKIFLWQNLPIPLLESSR